MKTILQIEKEINKRLDFVDKAKSKYNSLVWRPILHEVLNFIAGIEFVLDKRERLSISDKTRERLIKAIKEYRNGEISHDI